MTVPNQPRLGAELGAETMLSSYFILAVSQKPEQSKHKAKEHDSCRGFSVSEKQLNGNGPGYSNL